jgi:hypothetical protein
MFYHRNFLLKTIIFGVVLATANQALPSTAMAQEVSVAAQVQTVRVPAGTAVELEFVDTLNSKTNTTGQLFAVRLREPIVVDGQIVVPAGAIGGGEVIDASRAGMGGRAGKLILSGRFLEVQGQRVRIRGLQSVLAGQDRSRTAVNTALLVPYVGFLGGFIQGGEIEVSSGTAARAFLATDFILSPPIQSTQPEVTTPPAPPSTNPEVKGNP